VSHSKTVTQHLPLLRRYARALTGDQISGDAYVAEAMIAIRRPCNPAKKPARVCFEARAVIAAARQDRGQLALVMRSRPRRSPRTSQSMLRLCRKAKSKSVSSVFSADRISSAVKARSWAMSLTRSRIADRFMVAALMTSTDDARATGSRHHEHGADRPLQHRF
jgi:hypothetical protein